MELDTLVSGYIVTAAGIITSLPFLPQMQEDFPHHIRCLVLIAEKSLGIPMQTHIIRLIETFHLR